MSSENMRDYIQTYYPENLPLFQNNISPGPYIELKNNNEIQNNEKKQSKKKKKSSFFTFM